MISLTIWLYLTLARGTFWRLTPFDDDQSIHPAPSTWPDVVAVVPARNEAQTIAPTTTSLLQQNYPGQYSVVVVDDHSEDQTAQRAQQSASEIGAESRITIRTASPLPPGWTGKLWALNEGISKCRTNPVTSNPAFLGVSSRAPEVSRDRGICLSSFDDPAATANGVNPVYFWFTDADIVHAPDTLRCLVARAEQNHLDLTSLMVLLRAKSLHERALIPAFLFFFLKLYPPRWTADPNSRTAGAAGGCILLRRQALTRIGGLAAIRTEVIDDCALARAVKHTGGKIWMGLTRASQSQRAYLTFSEIRDMIARTAFTQLRYSPALFLGTLAGMFLTYIAPVALLFAHYNATRALALTAYLLMSLAFLPTIRFYRLSPLWTPLLPLAALFYAYATTLSALRYWLNRGAQWKGRSQARRQP
jgi:cellulose synthase/poly-beta-1,6-N-acetylglucosamine synthase-like glycosyltransferase